MNRKLSLGKGARASETLAWNMKLIAHHELDGFGGMGEGTNMQLAPDGRSVLLREAGFVWSRYAPGISR